MVVTQAVHEIPRKKFYVVKLRKVENVRLHQYGGRNIQLLTNLRKIIEKTRIYQLFGFFIYELFTDMPVRNQFCPNSHRGIIHENAEKVNRLTGAPYLFFCFFTV